MNETNLLASLVRLTTNASFVIQAIIYYLQQQRGLEELTPPAFELKTEKEWAMQLATLTPEEINTLSSLTQLFQQPRPTLSSAATYVVTSAMSSLEQQAGALDITTPTTEQKTGEQWATELAALAPQDIARIANVITWTQQPDTFSSQNLTIDPLTGTSPLSTRLNQIANPKTTITKYSFEEQQKRQAQLQKMIDTHFAQREAELARAEQPTPTTKPAPPPTPTKPTRPPVAPALMIERVPYPKWWRDSLNATIKLTAPGTQVLATVTGKLRLFVATIVITVTGETQITIKFGDAGSSGPIYLGAEGQPKGFVAAMGNSPAPCGHGALTITATDPNDETPSVSGWATCFAEEV